MKRSMLALALFAVAGSSSALSGLTGFSAGNLTGSVATFISGSPQFPNGFAGATPFFFAGNTVEGFAAGRNGFSGFAVVSTAGTPLAPLGLAAQSSFNTFYNTLLPVYVAIDGPATLFAAPAQPVLQPLAARIVTGAAVLSNVLNGSTAPVSGASLPGLQGLTLR